MVEMKTLTILSINQDGESSDKTYELVDEKARAQYESLKGVVDSLANTGSSVAVTVNGIAADETGNIALAAKDVKALSINKENAVEGASVPVNADTLGGIPANQYALKSDISGSGAGSSTEGSSTPCIPSGGSTGQILAKSSNNDYDTRWVDMPSGSIDPDEPIDADTLEGKTLEEIKTTILTDSEVNASKLDGMTFEELKAAILAEVVYQ